jgi:hypothetical protein
MNPKIVCAAFLFSPALGLAIGACANRENVDAVPGVPVASTEPTATDDGGAPLPDGAPPKRTLSLRNPMGDGPANNLLLDGDFELSTSFGTGQYGWRMFNGAGNTELAMTLETGGLCRSGLSCVKLEHGRLMLGRGTAAAGDKGHVMGLYARMPDGVACTELSVYAVACDSFQVLDKAAPDPELADGWCHYTSAFGPSKSSVCMYLKNTLPADQVALVDAAVLGPADGTVPLKNTDAQEPDAETLAEMARVRDHVRRTTRFGRPPAASPLPAD